MEELPGSHGCASESVRQAGGVVVVALVVEGDRGVGDLLAPRGHLVGECGLAVAGGAVPEVGVEARVVRLERDGDTVAPSDGGRYVVGPNEIVRVGEVWVVETVGV